MLRVAAIVAVADVVDGGCYGGVCGGVGGCCWFLVVGCWLLVVARAVHELVSLGPPKKLIFS